MAKKKAVKKAKKSKKKTVKKKVVKKSSKAPKKNKRSKHVRVIKPARKPIKIKKKPIRTVIVKIKENPRTDAQLKKARVRSGNTVVLRIQRYVPEKDITPYFAEYEYKLKNNDTVLEALKTIKATKDDSLTYRGACRMGICGACAIRVNGHAVLACNTLLKDIISDSGSSVVTIEPLKNFKPVKDLVVDMTPFWKEMDNAFSWLIPKKESVKTTSEAVEKIRPAGNCIMCGACMSDCSVVREDKKFMGPAAILKSYRFVYDPRDMAHMDRLYYCNKYGLWKCTEMFNCVEQCPKNIDVHSAIASLRAEAIRQGFTGAGVRYTKSFTSTVKASGKVDEVRLMVAADPFRALKSYKAALRMFKHDKKPSLFPKRIKDYDKFRKIIDKVDDGR